MGSIVRRSSVAALAGVLAVSASGCSLEEWQRGAMPEPATSEGDITLTLWQGSWIAALAVGVLTWGLILWAVFRYRRKDGDALPAQTRYNIPIEILYTVAPLIMIMVLFVFTADSQAKLTNVSNEQDHTVGVVGFRWSWAFNYVEEGVYEVGSPGQPPMLYLPVNEKVQFELTSPDVIHSFWVPAFVFKMDVIPGRTNRFELTPDTLGTFKGKCTELCGVDHARMLFDVKVVTRAEFDAHIADLKAKGQTGLFETGRYKIETDSQKAQQP